MSGNISFEKAPLIEIIAELRWLPPNVMPQQGQPTFVGDADQLAMTFARHPGLAAFPRIEKLVPQGFPSMLHEVAWRFRSPEAPGALLQIGSGIFTANALPPYKRWSDFRRTVENGVNALLAARTETEKHQPFVGLSLCYMNAFLPDVMMGYSQIDFIKKVLGFNVILPNAIARIESTNRTTGTTLNLLLPIEGKNKTIAIMVADGTMRPAGFSQANPAVLLNMTVAETKPAPADTVVIMQLFDEARNTIHDAFLEMTSDIHDLMQPKENE